MTFLPAIFVALAIIAPESGTTVSVRKPVKIAWRGPADAVYLVNVCREGGQSQIFCVSNRTDAYLANLELDSKFSWSVRQAGSFDKVSACFVSEAKGPRLLMADGVRGLRDIGGWKTPDGRKVRQNRIFRSAALRTPARRVTANGVATLRTDFGIRTHIDLRTFVGDGTTGGSCLGKDIRWYSVPFFSGNRIDQVAHGREPFARVFSLLQNEKNYPVLLECANGNERSGTMAFLLNGLLGVNEEDLRRDWSASLVLLSDLLAYVNSLPGATLAERIESYARRCGITAEEIMTFRTLMLE